MQPCMWTGPRRKQRGEQGARRATPVSPFFRAVYRIVRRVPEGRVVTYGQVAVLAGRPRAARAVGQALRALGEGRARTVPWHRVVNGSGRISERDLFGAEIQRECLEAEGVPFDATGRIDLEEARWVVVTRRPWVSRPPAARTPRAT